MKLSLIIAIVFCILSLKLLIDDRYKVDYKFEEKYDDVKKLVKFCFDLNIKPFYNSTHISVNKLGDKFLDYLSSPYFIESTNEKIKKYSFKKENEDFIIFEKALNSLKDLLKSKNYFIYKDQICVHELINSIGKINGRGLDLLVFRKYIDVLINNCNDFKCPNSKLYNFDKKTLSIYKIKLNPFIKEDRIIVNKTLDRDSNCKSTDYSQFKCLNDCLRSNRLSRYYYEGNENCTIILDYDLNITETELVSDNETRSIVANEENCLLNECKEEDCILNSFSKFGDYKLLSYISRPLISDFDFIFQFISLFFLYLNLNIYLIFSTVFLFLFSKFNKFNLILEIILILLCLTILTLMFINLINDYKLKSYNTTTKQIISTDLELNLFDIIVCFKFDFFDETDFKEKSDLSISATINHNLSIIISNKTLSIAEIESDNLKHKIKDVYIKFGHKKEQINWNISDKVLFRFISLSLLKNKITYSHRKNEKSSLDLQSQRCFQIAIELNESRYKNLLALSKIKIELYQKTRNDFIIYRLDKYDSYYRVEHNIHIIPKNNNFNTKSSPYFNTYEKIIRQKTIRLTKNCFNYTAFKHQNRCDSQADCIMKCWAKNYFSKFSRLYVRNMIIDKDQFTIDQWQNTNITFDYGEISDEIRMNCDQIFNKKGCDEVNYINKVIITSEKNPSEDTDTYETELSLYHNVLTKIEGEKTSIIDLLLEMLNIQSVLFGLNILNLINKIMAIFMIKLSKDNQKYLIIYYLVFVIGPLIHLIVIFFKIIHEELIENQFYENQKSIQMPDINLCFDHHKDLNRELTYSDLDNLTKEWNIDNLFTDIMYLDNANKWNKLDRKLNFTDKKFQIQTFYFLDKKCFQLKLEMNYNRTQFMFKDGQNQVLKINFNQWIDQSILNDNLFNNKSHQGKSLKILFFTKKKDKLHFSEFSYLDGKVDLENMKLEIPLVIKEEYFEIDYYDRYYLIKYFIKNLFKNPLAIFNKKNHLNDANQYFTNLINDFSTTHKSTTLNLPIEKNSFNYNLMINDALFENYSRYVQDINGQIVTPNYRKEFAIHDFENDETFTFTFELSFFKRIIKFRNKDTWTKLIINLLNVITLWIGFNPISFFTFKTTFIGKLISDYFKNRNDENYGFNQINELELQESNFINNESENHQ